MTTLLDGKVTLSDEHGGDFRILAVRPFSNGGVRLDAELALIHLRHEGSHQLTISD